MYLITDTSYRSIMETLKKLVKILLLSVVVLILIGIKQENVLAASMSANLTGPDVVRTGDTITLSFNVAGSAAVYGVQSNVSFDSNQVSLTAGPTLKVGGSWKLETGSTIIAYDDALSSPVTGSKTIYTVSFKVKAAVGSTITVSITGIQGTVGSGMDNVSSGNATYSVKVQAPLTGNTNLKSLTVSNGDLSPAFLAGTKNYTMEVPFSVSKLDISAEAEDGTVKINSPQLKEDGDTQATVTVTAQNGSTSTYIITVHRAKDPNYVASSICTLSEIKVDGYVLSPVFTTERTSYVVWLPYETTAVNVTGTPTDTLASVKIEGGTDLKEGKDNEIKIICTAEDGTEKTYIVVAKRAAGEDSVIDDTTSPNEITTEGMVKESTDDVKDGDNTGLISMWIVFVVGIVSLLVGGAVGFVINILINKDKKIDKTTNIE